MNGVKHHVTRVIRTGMVCDDLSRATDNHTIHEAFDPDLTVAIGNRHRVIIAAVTHDGCRRHLTTLQITGFKGGGRQAPHRGQISFQPFTDADLVAAQDVGLPFAALFFKIVVERIPVSKARDRHHEVAPSVANQAFYLAFVIPFAGATITISDHIVR